MFGTILRLGSREGVHVVHHSPGAVLAQYSGKKDLGSIKSCDYVDLDSLVLQRDVAVDKLRMTVFVWSRSCLLGNRNRSHNRS